MAQVQHPVAQPRLGVHLSALSRHHLTVGVIVIFRLLRCRTLDPARLLLLLSQCILVLAKEIVLFLTLSTLELLLLVLE